MASFDEGEKCRVNFTPEQTGQLISELPIPLNTVVEFSIYGGFRRDNILSLKTENIHFHDLTSTGEVDLIIKDGRRETIPYGRIGNKRSYNSYRWKKRRICVFKPAYSNKICLYSQDF